MNSIGAFVIGVVVYIAIERLIFQAFLKDSCCFSLKMKHFTLAALMYLKCFWSYL